MPLGKLSPEFNSVPKKELQPNAFSEQKEAESPVENEQEKEKNILAETTVYINAGGQGSRLKNTIKPADIIGYDENRVTKALLKFSQSAKPLIDLQLQLIKELGFKNIVVGAGDHKNISEYLKNSQELASTTEVITTDKQEDTGGDFIKALRQANNPGKHILVENVDTLIYIDNLPDLLEEHIKNKATATIVLTELKGVPNEGAFLVADNGQVIFSREGRNQENSPEPEGWQGFRGSSTGVVVFDTAAVINYPWQEGDGPLSIYKDILPDLIKSGGLYAYNNGKNLFKDIGTEPDYLQAKRHEDKLLGALGNKYLKNKNTK